MTNFKSLLALIIIPFLIIGCGQGEQSEQTPQRGTVTHAGLPYGIQILTIDGCEYIKATEGFNTTTSISIIHKANCPNHGDTTETK